MTLQTQVDIGELRQITAWLAASDVEFIEFHRGGVRVRLTLEARDPPAAIQSTARRHDPQRPGRLGDTPVTVDGDTALEVRAPVAGRFLAVHPAGSAPLAAVGTRVTPGDVLGLVQIVDLCVPVVAATSGVVRTLLAQTGANVGYGAPLFALSPERLAEPNQTGGSTHGN